MKTYTHIEVEIEVDFDHQKRKETTWHEEGHPEAVATNSVTIYGVEIDGDLLNKLLENNSAEIDKACWEEVRG